MYIFNLFLSAPAYILTHLAYNVLSAYLIVWWLLSVVSLSSVFSQANFSGWSSDFNR